VEFINQLDSKGIPESNKSWWIDKYLENKARKTCTPLKGTFELTPLCNLDCKMCYIHLDGATFPQSSLLSVDVWKELINQARKAGMLRATLTGGECLTFPGFDELYLYLCELGIPTAILSNGVLMDDRRVDFLKHHPPRAVQITLYGSCEDSYERVTGHRVFRRVYNSICALRDAGINVRIGITPSEYSVDDTEALIDTVEALGVRYTFNSGRVPPRENTGRSLHDLTTDQYMEMRRIRRGNDQTPLTPIDPAFLPQTGPGKEEILGLPCGGGKSAFCISYDGSMSPCNSLPELQTFPLKVGFEQAWEQLNELADAFLYPRECVGCAYRSICVHCVARHKNAQPGHCDMRICERTKALVSAGYIRLPEDDNS